MEEAVTRYQLAEFGALLAEPARAAIVLALLDGHARPAGELASLAGVGAATASAHLRKLSEAGLLGVVGQGRHRYYRLADDDVAHGIETLMLAAPARRGRRVVGDRDFERARTCYRHLAGRLGVALFERLRAASGVDLDASGVRLNREGAALLRDVDLFARDAKIETLEGRTCVDWTERRFHLSGPLGTAIARNLIDRRWLLQRDGSRALGITTRGREGLRALDIAW